MLKCDFCMSPPTWDYPCKAFLATPDTGQQIVSGSFGGWLACEVCHSLIESGDYTALALRATIAIIEACEEMAPAADLILNDIKSIHRVFIDNREGPAKELTEAEIRQAAEITGMIELAPQHNSQVVIDLANAGLTVEEARAYLNLDATGAPRN